MNDNLGTAIWVAFVMVVLGVIGYLGYLDGIDRMTRDAHIKEAKWSLRAKAGRVTEYRGYTIVTEYSEPDVRVRTATATSEWGSVTKNDFDKSRIAGEYGARKAKHFWKGVKDGWKNEEVPE